MPKTPTDKPAKPAKAASAVKPEKAAKPAAKSAAKPAAANPAATGGLKLRDLITSVATATGAKKPDAKAAVEATLAALAEALKAGSDLTLPPLGKLRVVKMADKGGATMMTLKLRHGGGANAAAKPDGKPAGKTAAKPLAEEGEDD